MGTLTSSGIIARARELGFDRCGVAPAASLPELGHLREWIDRGYAGDMTWMARTAAERADVRRVMPAARSVVVAAMVYNVDRPYSTEGANAGDACISRYAWGEDYHGIVRRRLDALLAWMREEHGEAFEARAYVDTGPIQERVFARYAGIGWIGKNTCLIDPDLGSWLFLSAIVCSLPLEPGEPSLDHCGTCTLCLEACPTGALVEPRVLDATRCLSYLTIEHRGSIPVELREDLGAHVYGCDICQDVCPYNQIAARSERGEWQPRPAFDRPRLVDLWRRGDEELRAQLRGSPMKRANLVGLRRNIAVALGHSGTAEAAAALEEPDPRSPSKQDPVVAEAVAWSLRRLSKP